MNSPSFILILACCFLATNCKNVLFNSAKEKGQVIFQDDFTEPSQGKLEDNIVQLPPPKGLGYTWRVVETGYIPINWILWDKNTEENPLRGFWVIPPDSGYMVQGGRSQNSIIFANVAVPKETQMYAISFDEYRADNDFISYIIGAGTPEDATGVEFGYMTQLPGTDTTVDDLYIGGALGEKVAKSIAVRGKWNHQVIEVRNDKIKWTYNNTVMADTILTNVNLVGYFGIRHKYERNTRYDNVKITVYP